MRRALEIAFGLGLAWLAQGVSGLFLPVPSSFGSPPAPPAAAQAQVQPPAAGDAPRGEPLEGAKLRERADNVASYALRTSLDPDAHTLRGAGSITWRNASRIPQREIFVHLYLNGFKNDRTFFLRRPDSEFRGGGPVWDHGFIQVKRFHVRELDADVWPESATTPDDPEDETDIRVPLPRAVEPGESITIDVAWEARLPSITLRTGYLGRFHMAAQWFPKIARLKEDGRWAHFPFHRFSEFYSDFGAYDVTIDVPEAFVVGATGRLESEVREGGRAVRRFTQGDVHDFAFTAWDQFREATATTDDGIAIRCLYPPGHERSASIELDAARFGLEHYGRAYGRYPYQTLTIVHPPEGAGEAGGMEYPTLITTGGEWFLPWSGAHNIHDVTLHELAHQWFYGLVATNEHDDPFLDEGVTSYAEIDAMEALFPGASFGSWPGVSIGLPAIHRAFSLEADQNAAVALPAAEFMTGLDYGALVYARASTSLLSLSNVYGQDVLRSAIGLYARRYRFEHPEPESLLNIIREAAGDEAAEALRVALFERGWVDYSIDTFSPAGSLAPRGVFGAPDKPSGAPSARGAGSPHGAVLVRRRGTIVLPVDVDLVGEDGSIERVRWDAKETAAWLPYSGASPLVAAVVDPERRVLLDKDLSNNARRAGTNAVAWRALERAGFAAEVGLLMLSP